MGFGKQLKEVAASVLPIVVIASVLGWIFGIFTLLSFAQFLFSALLVVLGLTLFLLGVNVGFLPVGNHLGAMITQKRNVPLLVFSGIGLGILITLAEPDVKVLADQVASMKSGLSSSLLVFIIAIGVGVFMAISYVRALTRFSLKITMAVGVALMFIAASFVPEFFVSVGFDSGGATTGPMAVPFIMALGMGVASVHGHHEEDSFGYTGIASIGPVLAILVFGAFMGGGSGSIVTEETVSGGMLEMFTEVALSVTKSLLPLVIICVLVQIFFMKLPRIRATRMYMGILYSYVGITLFLFAVESTFMDIARTLGRTIATIAPGSLIPIGLVLGACVVLAEPAIWVLTEQVEEVSEGKIKRFLLLAFIAIGVACAVMLSMIRVINGTSIWYFLLPGYAVIVALLPFVPTLFVGIGFDSGGVATGPMSSTFLLPFVSGAAAVLAEDPSSMAFGMIGLIAMMPILAIEILGLVFSLKVKKGQKNVEEKND